METIKERNYKYDKVRGFCMYLIVLQHFILKGGYTFDDNVGNLIYVGVDIFAMQTFFFLSGMFSKNPEKGRDKMFQSLLWPVILVGIFFWPGVYWYLGQEKAFEMFISGWVPYAMWFLIALFIYKYFLKYYSEIKHLLLIALILYLGSAIFEPLSVNGFAIGRTFSFFISFVMGYLLTMEKVEDKFTLKVWQTIILGIVLIAVSYCAITYLPDSYLKATKLNGSYTKIGMTVLQGIMTRIGILILSTGWMIFLYNLFSEKKGFWAHIGMNTMPIYIFHLLFSGIFLVNGFTFGLISFEEHEVAYVIAAVVVSFLVTAVLSTKPAGKAYHVFTDGTYNAVRRIICMIKG